MHPAPPMWPAFPAVPVPVGLLPGEPAAPAPATISQPMSSNELASTSTAMLEPPSFTASTASRCRSESCEFLAPASAFSAIASASALIVVFVASPT